MSDTPPKRPTMRDVAVVAGVSFKSVSRVVNAEAGVSEELRERVRAAIATLGYRPDPAASSLRRLDGRTGTIALVVDDVANPFSAALQRGIEDAAAVRGVLVLAASSDDDRDRERTAVGLFVDRRVDGIILMTAAEEPDGGAPPVVAVDRPVYDTPFVAVDRPAEAPGVDAVLVDNHAGAVTAVTHLMAHGHRRIAFLGDRQTIFTARERLRGYRDALAAAGLPPDPALERPGLLLAEEARAALRALLGGPEPPTAVFTARNVSTVGAIRALHELGRQREVALVGFDDLDLADVFEPGVSVIAQAPARIGGEAAALLFARIDGDRSAPRVIHVPTTLVQRGSGEIRPPG